MDKSANVPDISRESKESLDNDFHAQSNPSQRTPPRRKSKSRACASPGRGPLHNGLMSAAWPSSPKYPLRSATVQGQFQSSATANGFPEYGWTVWRQPVSSRDQEEDMEVDNHDSTVFKPIQSQNIAVATTETSTVVKPSVQAVKIKPAIRSSQISSSKANIKREGEHSDKKKEDKTLLETPGKTVVSHQPHTPRADNIKSPSCKAAAVLYRASKSADNSSATAKSRGESSCATSCASAGKPIDRNTKSKEKLAPIFIVVHTNRVRIGNYAGSARSPVKIYAERIVIQIEDEATSTERTFRVMCNQLTDLQVNFSIVPFFITMKARTIQDISGSPSKNNIRQNKKTKESGETIILDLAYEKEVPHNLKEDFEVLFKDRLADLGLWKERESDEQIKEDPINSNQEEKENVQNLKTDDQVDTKGNGEAITSSPLGGARKRTPSKSLNEEENMSLPTNNNDIKVARRCLFQETDMIEERIKSLEHEAAHYQLLVGQKRLDIQRMEQQVVQKDIELERLREDGHREISRLNDELLDQTNRVSNVEGELSQERVRANDLFRQLHILETSTEEKDQIIQRHEQAILVRDNQLKQVRSHMKRQEESTTPELKKIVKKAETDLENTRTMLEETRLTKVNLSEELRRNVELISRLHEQVSDGDSRRRDVEDQLSARNSRVTQLEGENERLLSDARQYRERADSTDGQLQECRGQLEEKTRLQQGLEDQLRGLRDRLDENLTRIGHLTAERDSCVAESNLLQSDLNSAMDRLRQLGSDFRRTAENTFSLFQSEPPDWLLNRNEITITEQTLGIGAWGNVKLGKFRGTSVAVKQIHQLILSPHNRRLFEREMTIASRCRHPCLLQFIGATNYDGTPLFITEVLETDLRSFLSRQPLEQSEIITLCHDTTRALNYLHLMQPISIIHRDISSSNILLWHERNSLRAKLSDYGAANFMRLSMTRFPGASLYSAPEAGTSEQTPKIDIYSFGVLFIEMCLREIPVIQQRTEQMNRVENIEYRNLINQCIHEIPIQRPTASELITHFDGHD